MIGPPSDETCGKGMVREVANYHKLTWVRRHGNGASWDVRGTQQRLGVWFIASEWVEVVEGVDVIITVRVPLREALSPLNVGDGCAAPSAFDEHERMIWATAWRSVPPSWHGCRVAGSAGSPRHDSLNSFAGPTGRIGLGDVA